MLKQTIEEGALFYGKTRRRCVVRFDTELRVLTVSVIENVRKLLYNGQTPAASYEPRQCDSCSLIDDCQPRVIRQHASVKAWFERQLED
jgi:CRISPR-associated exonuclease Cas4